MGAIFISVLWTLGAIFLWFQFYAEYKSHDWVQKFLTGFVASIATIPLVVHVIQWFQ